MQNWPHYRSISVVILMIHTVLIAVCTRQSAQNQPAEWTSDCQHDRSNFRCVQFVSNYDADTITVNIPDIPPLLGEKISVRIRGVDSAERRGKNACEADAAERARLKVHQILSSARRIDLRNIGRDKYFRILADVHADGQSVGNMLIEQGLGVAYAGGTKRRVNWCASPKDQNPARQPPEN